MKPEVLISIAIFVLTPIIMAVVLTKQKNDRINTVTMAKLMKILFVFASCFFSGAMVYCLINEDFSNPAWSVPYFFGAIFVIAPIIALIWSFTYKITINDDHFIYRNIFGKSKTYSYDEITGIKRLKGNEFISTFKIVVGKGKIEVSNAYVNYDMIYKKLNKEKIFKKFSRPLPKKDKQYPPTQSKGRVATR